MSDPYQFGRVSVYVKDDTGSLHWDALIEAVAEIDLPAKVMASLSASFFCDDASISLTEQDCAWYNAHQDELKEIIQTHISYCDVELTITWVALTDRMADVFPSDRVWRFS